jgi:hypothetical protein
MLRVLTTRVSELEDTREIGNLRGFSVVLVGTSRHSCLAETPV